MVESFYERLSAQDSSFLPYETRSTHMHITWAWIFEAGALLSADGGIHIQRIRDYIASRLHWIPRYRQRISYIPVENDPIWVDDDRFHLSYHVRHTSLPQPGDLEQLKLLTARISSQQLDRSRPLWELWVVEGLEGGRFALVSKTHHCMVDGVSTVDLMSVLLSRTPKSTVDDPPRWIPRPAPSRAELVRDALWRRARAPMEIARGFGSALRALQEGSELEHGLSAAWSTITAGLSRPPTTPLNGPIGPHRRIDWLRMDVREVREVKNRLGGTVNDVILATVAGAVRSFLKYRNASIEEIDFQVVLPVSIRSPEERGALGNRASAWVISLPIHIADPKRRFARVREATLDLKESKEAMGADLMMQVADWAGSNLMALGVGVLNRLLRPYNMVVTNIPGSRDPFYLLEARLLEAYPQVPLFADQGLGVAVSSYDDLLCWGLNADWDLVPDLTKFTEAIAMSFRELREAAGPPRARSGGRKPRAAQPASVPA